MSKEAEMDRTEIVSFLRSEVETIQEKLKGLAEAKADSDGPRTSWHSQIHLDIERLIDNDEKYLARCQLVLVSLENSKTTGLVGSGSIVSLKVDGEMMTCFLVENGGGSIGNYSILSSKSPIGKAIWGKKPNEKVEVNVPDGTTTIEILEVG